MNVKVIHTYNMYSIISCYPLIDNNFLVCMAFNLPVYSLMYVNDQLAQFKPYHVT